MRSASIASAFVTALALAAPLRAQSFDVDLGDALGNVVPSNAFGGVIGQAGAWQSVPVLAGVATPLADVDGNATAVTATCSGGSVAAANLNLVNATSDDLALLDDALDPGAGTATVTIAGLAAGDYLVVTYAIGPDYAIFQTDVSVAGSSDPTQVVGGAFFGDYELGVTHARHRVTIASGGALVVSIAKHVPGPPINYASCNGLQIVQLSSAGGAFCFGDGLDPTLTTTCPCANFGAAGSGCAHSASAAGAVLAGSGSAAADSVVLSASGMPASVACIYLQGDALTDVVFGDGVRCAGGALLRLRTRVNVAGASQFPDGADTVTLAARGGVVPGSGVRRFYQTYYRNSAAFCTPDTFNVTNGWRVDW